MPCKIGIKKGTCPDIGSQLILSDKYRMLIIPSQKLGIDCPSIAIAIKVPSIHLPLLIAAKIPNGIAPKTAIHIEKSVSSIVAGNASKITVIAD